MKILNNKLQHNPIHHVIREKLAYKLGYKSIFSSNSIENNRLSIREDKTVLNLIKPNMKDFQSTCTCKYYNTCYFSTQRKYSNVN